MREKMLLYKKSSKYKEGSNEGNEEFKKGFVYIDKLILKLHGKQRKQN
jgi:hypothetical protein